MSDPREEIVETMARLIRIEEPFAPAISILADVVGERRRGAREPLGQTRAKRARSTREATPADAIDH